MKCRHEWRKEGQDDLVQHYFYCVHCLAEAVIVDGFSKVTVNKRIIEED